MYILYTLKTENQIIYYHKACLFYIILASHQFVKNYPIENPLTDPHQHSQPIQA